MSRRNLGPTTLLVCISLFGLGSRTLAADDAHSHHNDACAKACADCMRACESCANHCFHMVAEGKKENMKTAATCADCAEFCASAARIVSRQGPMSATICEACAKACDQCAAECEKFPNDKHMKDCAKACRDCSKACREMIEHTK